MPRVISRINFSVIHHHVQVEQTLDYKSLHLLPKYSACTFTFIMRTQKKQPSTTSKVDQRQLKFSQISFMNDLDQYFIPVQFNQENHKWILGTDAFEMHLPVTISGNC